MKILLENFRGVVRRVYEIPDNSLISVTGASGAGKSTLFEAILFVLHDLKSNIYPKNTSEKQTTKVAIVTPFIKISRSKRPSFLKAKYKKREYEDEQAQAIINKLFGNKELWEMTSYIPQGHDHLFIGMPSAKKNDIITDIALQGYDDSSALMEKVDDILSNNKKRHGDLLVEYKATQKMLDMLSDEYSLCDNVEELEDRIHEIDAEREELKVTFHELLSEVGKAKEIAKKTQLLSHSDFGEITEETLTKKKQELKEILQQINVTVKYSKERKELKELEWSPNALTEEILKDLALLVDWNPSYLSEVEEDLETWDKWESYIKLRSLCESHGKLLSKLEKLPKVDILHEMGKIPKTGLECPSCHETLTLLEGHLHSGVHPDVHSDEDVDVDDLQIMLDVYKKREMLEKDISEIQKNLHKEDTFGLLKSLDRSRGKLSSLDEVVKPKLSRASLLENLKIEKKKHRIHRELGNLDFKSEQKKFQTNRRITRLKEILENIPEYDVDELKEREKILREEIFQIETYLFITSSKTREVSEIEKEIFQIQNKDKILGEERKDLKRKVKENSKAENYLKFKEDAENIREEATLLYDDISAYDRIKIAISSATGDMMNTFLHKLNLICNEVLQRLFDEPIRIKIDSFTKLKTRDVIKPQISIEISFKGNIYVGFAGLSGGERSRISVALLIAFSKLKGSRIILLDEVMSALDVDTKNKIVEVIREYIKDTTVMMINHDTNDSLYDSVLEI